MKPFREPATPKTVTSRKGRVSRNMIAEGFVKEEYVTSRKGRVSRNDFGRMKEILSPVTSRKGRVSRNQHYQYDFLLPARSRPVRGV